MRTLPHHILKNAPASHLRDAGACWLFAIRCFAAGSCPGNNVQEMNGARNETLSAIESISDASTQTAECSSSVHSAAGTQLDAIKNLDEASQSLTTKAQSLLDALSTFQV